MSKYQILKNTDTAATLTDDDEQHFVIFDNDDHNQSTHSYGDDDRDHRNDYRARDLIEYNDTIKYDDNDNSKCFINNRLNASNNNNHSTGKVCITNGGNNNNGSLRCTSASSNDLLITTLEADESTMEIPLLQHGYCNNNNKNYANNNKDETEYACLCQQKGFACNLNSKSTQTAKSKILWAIGMCCIFMIVEFLGGYIAGSLAIMTDAAHLASDCISFVIGLVAIWLGNKPPDAKMSFGYKRLEVMGAIISILSIWILTATLVLVAVQRIFAHDYDLDADTMMTISGIGILINIIMIFILHTSSAGLPEGGIIGAAHGHSHSHSHSHNHSHSDNHHGHSHHSPRFQRRPLANDNSHWHPELLVGPAVTTSTAVTGAGSGSGSDVDISGPATSIELSSGSLVLDGNGLKHQQDGSDVNLNLRAATIHAIGDLVQSFGVFIASVLIKLYPTAVILDPLCTMLFSVIVIMTTINLFKESMHIIMDSVPKGISVSDLEMDLLNIEGVKSVHHLNVWNHTTGHTIFMAHLVIDLLVDSNTVLRQATQLLSSSKYNVKHSTIQMERVTS